jgi:NAD(P)-dependent dehydrogenase (short-subunit alcohol dehydrogenase family)
VSDNAPRIAVVTGGGTGIGAAAALALAEDGWAVTIVGRRREPLAEVAARHPGLTPVATDVTDEDAVSNLFAEVVERHGRLDLLFNNAGRGASSAEVGDVDPAEWRAVVELNVTGTFLCSREAFRIMRTQQPRGGRIINNGSISAHAPRPRSIAYTATKHAVTGITKATDLDGRPYGISCGQIDIGNAATSMTDAMTAGVLQADGSVRPEPTMDVTDVGRAIVYMASLPPTANVATLTVMASGMPFVGRG